jgi:hypothetical protein
MSDQGQRTQAQKSFPAPISVLPRLATRSKRILSSWPSFITSCSLVMRCRHRYGRRRSKVKPLSCVCHKGGRAGSILTGKRPARKWSVEYVDWMTERPQRFRIFICRRDGIPVGWRVRPGKSLRSVGLEEKSRHELLTRNKR